jgi:TIR domain
MPTADDHSNMPFVVVVCLSRRSINKIGFVQKEISLALNVADQQPEGSIFIILAKIEECDVPDRLRKWRWVNLYEEDGYDRLIAALRVRGETLRPFWYPA